MSKSPVAMKEIENAVTLARGGKQNLPDTRARQKVEQAGNKFGHG